MICEQMNDYSSDNERISHENQAVFMLVLMLFNLCFSYLVSDTLLVFVPLYLLWLPAVWHVVRTIAYKRLIEGRWIARVFITCYLYSMGLSFVDGYIALLVTTIPFICIWGYE